MIDSTDIDAKVASLLSDPLWRLNNLYWIEGLTPEGKLQKMKFRMNDVQQQFFDDFWWRNMVLKSRQHGLSTLTSLMQLDQCIFNEGQTAGIIDRTDDDAKKKLLKQKYAFDHLDDEDDPHTSHLGAMIKEKIKLIAPTNDHNITFSNDSKIWCGTSGRGGTISFLWISELGHIAYFNQKKADEIRTGSLPAVHQECKVVIESTHEGGKHGFNYEMIKTAQESPPEAEMTPLDWQFHFYPWFADPKNTTPVPDGSALRMTPDQKEYFDTLLADHAIDLSTDQKNWYIRTEKIQKDGMKKEHPSTPEEAISASIVGAIYGAQVAQMRKDRRICDFGYDRAYPLWSFWDLGQSDYTSMGLIQFTGRDFQCLDSFTWMGEDYRFYVDKLLEWERMYGYIEGDYIPHDGRHKQGPERISWEDALMNAGRKNVTVVPRTPDIWIGIRHLRSLMNRMWIHATNNDVERTIGTGSFAQVIPSLITCIESYRTKPQESGAIIQEMPLHDENSHTCDMLRTFAESHARGLLKGATSMEKDSRRGGRGVRVITEDSDMSRTRRRRVPNILS